MRLFKPFRTNQTTQPSVSGSPRLDFEVATCADVGCVREANEDSVGCVRAAGDPSRRGLIVVVADGMGGHAAGEVASRLAVETVQELVRPTADNLDKALERAFKAANRRIYQTARKKPELRGMGTTCTALVLRDEEAYAAHVGDSRLYLVRNQAIYQMTQDHSEVMEMVRRGLLTSEQAKKHDRRNVLLRAMGNHRDVEVNIWKRAFPTRAGDCFLLCSDGLYDLVADDEIAALVSSEVPAQACRRLIELAKERGGLDNITVAIVRVREADTVRAEPKATREMEVMP